MGRKPSQLHIASGLSFPLEAITQTFGILAKKGAGKTYTSMVMAEEMLETGMPVVILDPLGVCWGLRSSASGKRAGLPITIFGGEHADVPLESTSGEMIADLIVRERISCVLDMSKFNNAEQDRFAAAFAARLYHMNRKPLHLMVDEADSFCLPDDTELLTKEGWKSCYDLSLRDKACCFNPVTQQYSYESLQRLILRKYTGEMVRISTQSLDCVMTPDHRALIRRVQRGQGRYRISEKWMFCAAEKLSTCILVPSGGAPCGNGLPFLSLQDMRVLGWIITDGCIHDKKKKKFNLSITQSVATRKRGKRIAHEMHKVLSGIPGISRYVRRERISRHGRTRRNAEAYQWYFGGESSAKFLSYLGSDVHQIPRLILEEASHEQLAALFEGLMEGDGTATEQQWRAFYPGQNGDLADQFQELALKVGFNTTKKWISSIGQWHVYVVDRQYHWVRKPEREMWCDATVWDITIPSGAFVARRNGTIFVTGNCPQKPMKGQEKMLGAFNDIVRRGRARGLGVTLITQRSAVINKNVLTQIDVLIVLRTNAPQDRKAIGAWTEIHGDEEKNKQMMDSLAKLDIGEAWVWSAGWLDVFKKVKIRKRYTFDSSATPKFGGRIKEPKTLAPVDLARIKDQMAETIAKAKQEDPRELKRKIAELTRELQKKVPVATQVKEKIIEKVVVEKVPALSKRQAKEIKKVSKQFNSTLEGITDLRLAMEGFAGVMGKVVDVMTQGPKPRLTSKAPEPTRPVPDVPGKREKKSEAVVDHQVRKEVVGSDDSEKLLAGERRMIEVLARVRKPLTMTQVATLAGLSPGSGTVGNYFGKLVRLGYLVKSGKMVELVKTPEDVRTDPLTREEVLAMWKDKFLAGERRMLDVLIELDGAEISSEGLAEKAGLTYPSGTFGNYEGKLRRNGLADKEGKMIKLSETMFLGT